MREYHVNSIWYWWPLVKDVGVPVPRTTLVEYRGHTLESESEEWDRFAAKVRRVCDGYGYPVFMRCGGLSGKHQWVDTCYVDAPEKVSGNAYRILEAVLMVMGTRVDFDGIAVRELLELEHSFTAFKGMPMAKEFRFFARNGEYECHHPYWPPSSIRRPSVDSWLEELKALQALSSDELEILKGYTARISKALDAGPQGMGWWSIDFCKTVDGVWYLTDLGTGEVSYHWNTCPHAPEDMSVYPHPEDPEGLAKIRGPTKRRERLAALKGPGGLREYLDSMRREQEC